MSTGDLRAVRLPASDDSFLGNIPSDRALNFTRAALKNINETGTDVAADLADIRSGEHTAASLLAECLYGADPDREQGWRDYVSAVAAAAEPATAKAGAMIETLGGRQYVRAEVGMAVFHASNYGIRGTVVAVHDGEVSVEYQGKSAGYEGPGVHRHRTFLLRTEAGSR